MKHFHLLFLEPKFKEAGYLRDFHFFFLWLSLEETDLYKLEEQSEEYSFDLWLLKVFDRELSSLERQHSLGIIMSISSSTDGCKRILFNKVNLTAAKTIFGSLKAMIWVLVLFYLIKEVLI
jgi:hypothetical protein